tara:strand:+ start:402 stop:587 length:186 start_codon:yes stop_codon:yes gene_type:complete
MPFLDAIQKAMRSENTSMTIILYHNVIKFLDETSGAVKSAHSLKDSKIIRTEPFATLLNNS